MKSAQPGAQAMPHGGHLGITERRRPRPHRAESGHRARRSALLWRWAPDLMPAVLLNLTARGDAHVGIEQLIVRTDNPPGRPPGALTLGTRWPPWHPCLLR